MKTVIRNSYTPKIGDYCETIVVDKETNNAYIFDCDGVFTPVPQPVDVEKILEEAAAYTDEQVAPLAEKLDTIEEGAQVNAIEHVLENGTELTITNKTVNVTVPTKTSDLTNDGSDGTDTYVESAALDDYYTKSETDTQIGYETTAREIADSGLQEQIDAIVASSDVVDIVGTYAALQAYDTSKLHDNDIIKVLTDETRDDATTYYRWDADTSTWGYIGAEGPFYTKAESDATFVPQTRTINGNALSSDVTLTAADVHALPDSTVIPTVNDATLTIQKNGTTVQTFTANQATNATANITVPTDTSDLTNGAGFITEEDVYDEVCESGKTITFQDAAPSSLSSFRLDGETSQNGTPTPSAPVPVKTVTGENVVKISDGQNEQSYEINLGKNLFDKDTMTLSNVAMNPNIISANGYTSVYIPCEPNTTYTVQKAQETTRFYVVTTEVLPAPGVQGTAISSSASGTVKTFTTGASARYIAVMVRSTSDTLTEAEVVAGVQIEKGSTATSYAAYFEPIELCKIGTYQDYIYKSDGKWYVRKETGKVDLGSLTWTNTTDTIRGSTGATGIKYAPNNQTIIPAYAECYRIRKGSGLSNFRDYLAIDTNRINVNTGSISITPTGIFYYALATPTDTEITNEALVAQLETLLNTARTYAGVNNIFTVTPNEQGTLEICYMNTILPYATKDKPGIVQIGDGLSVDSNGVISSDGLTSVDWDDVDNKPTNVSYWTNDAGYITAASLPTVNNATLTIQKNGTDVASFTANSSTATTANITVPTDTSDLTNGAGFITTAALANYYTKSETYTQNEVNSLINALSIPTKTSDLVNDSGFLTSIPVASANDLGGIKIGTGLSIDSDGVVSVTSAGTVAWADVTGKPTNVSYWTNDAGYITSASIPTNVSSFTNDAGYITSSDIPTNVSAFTNDAGYLTSSALSNYYTKSETYSQQEVNSLINTLPIPTKTSDLTNDGSDGTSTYVEADSLATVATTGDYGDLLNKPTIPSYSDFTGATSSTAGAHGLVPAPAAGDEGKFLQGDGTWATVSTGQTYTAGNGIDIDANNEISVDTTVVATQTDLSGKQDTLTAGDAIDITSNVISVEADSALDVSSTNPVQNSVVTAAINGKQDALTAGANITISSGTISATDTTYSDFVGTDGVTAGTAGLVPAPATTDAGEYLKADGTWDTPPGVTYTAGTGIDITGTTLSVDTSVIAEVSDLPTKTSDLTNDGSDGTSTYVEADDLATVATSGSYTDLSNKPTIPAAQVNSDWNANSGVAQILNKPSLATVATTGDYDDLSNTPSIPDYQAGDHIDITNGTISAIDYVHSENPVSITTPGTTVSGSEITDGSIAFSKVDSTQFLKLQLTTTDPGEGAALAANTLLGVYQ